MTHTSRPSLRRLAVILALALFATAEAAQAKTFAWKATGKGGTIYLMGSIHVHVGELLSAEPGARSGVQGLGPAGRGSRSRRDARSDGADEHPDARHAAVEPVARQGALAGDARAGPEGDRRSRHRRRAADALQAVDARDHAAGHGAAEGRLRSGARPRPAFLRSGEGRRQNACRGSRPWSIRSRASTR